MTGGINGYRPSSCAAERSFALVVGIERYDVGNHWNLQGPARDALRFARWLTDKGGLPAENIRLFVSALDQDAFDRRVADELPALRGRTQNAIEANIKKAILAELPECNGELLWIFWAGHGFIDGGLRTLLPYADAALNDVRHLNLESALARWRSDKVPAGRFAHQIALVDACRISAAYGDDFGSHEYPCGKILGNRRQFQLRASRPGETARNLTERQAGQFTDVMLERIGERSMGETVQNLESIARDMQARFAELRAQGLSTQTPQFERSRDWNDSSFLDDDWMGTTCAPLLDQAAWDGLAQAFRNRGLPAHAWEAYLWAFKISECAAPVSHTLPEGGWAEVVRDLDQRRGRRPDMPLAVAFVHFLAARAVQADPAWAAALSEWVKHTQDRLRLAALPPPPERTTRTVLYVRLESSQLPGRYFMRVWLYQDVFVSISETQHGPQSFAEIRQALTDQLLGLANGAAAPDGLQRPSTRVHQVQFDVEFPLLDGDPEAEFERWRLPIGRNGKHRELGHVCEVVVRCPDERSGLALSAWRDKWRWLTTRGGQHPDAVRTFADDDMTDRLAVELQGSTTPVCALAQVSDQSEALDALIEGGVPIAIWRRGGPPDREDPAGGLATTLVPQGGQNTSPALDVNTVPDTVRKLRLRHGRAGEPESWRHPLALLWDDPDAKPETRSLS